MRHTRRDPVTGRFVSNPVQPGDPMLYAVLGFGLSGLGFLGAVAIFVGLAS